MIDEELNQYLEDGKVDQATEFIIEGISENFKIDEIFEIIMSGAFCHCQTWRRPNAKMMGKVFDFMKETKWEKEKFQDQFGKDWRVAELIVMILHQADLIEHGTSIPFCWLTDKGKTLSQVIDEVMKITSEN